MDYQTRVLFAYPAAFKEGMSKEEMCIPSPYFAGIEPNTIQSIVINVGYSISYTRRSYILVNVDKVGDPKDYGNIIENGHSETLRAGFFDGSMGVFVNSFFMHDIMVKDSGFYEIQVQIFEADELGKKTDTVIHSLTSQFWVKVKEAQL